ncbi:MAG: hypothetical protein HY709_05545, partial [Candidatus Latescibacteria bacterium]|nr:hypothetical protein [Candidatus Latescibacterota bacterium]
ATLAGSSEAAPPSHDFVAYAIPLSGITIDGDLDDWPANRPDYPITWSFREQPTDQNDFSAMFSAGYNRSQRLLYVAVTVSDESILVEEPQWDLQDACEVYLVSGNVVDQYVLAPTSKRKIRPEFSGNPGAHRQPIEETRTRGAYQKTANGVIYEWALDLTPSRTTAGERIRFDIALCDRDDDESFSWMSWTPGDSKLSSRNRVGTLVLLKEGERVVQLSGTARYDDGNVAPFTLLSISQGSRRITYTITDGEGVYRTWFPPGGGYQVTAYSPIQSGGLYASGTSSITLTTEPASFDVEVPRGEVRWETTWQRPGWRTGGAQRIRSGKPVVVQKGEVVESAVAIGGDVTILGEAERAVAVGGNVTIGPGGRVWEEVVAVGGEVKMDSTTEVPNKIVEIAAIGPKFLWGLLPSILFGAKMASELAAVKVVLTVLYKILVLLVLLTLGILVTTFFPTQFDAIAQTVRHDPWRSAGIGLLAFLCCVPLTVLVAITIIGIPLIPLIGFAVIVSIFTGYFAVSATIGRELPIDVKWKTTFWAFGIGMVLLTLVNAIPFLGWLTWMVAVIVGLGATLLSRFGTMQVERGSGGK